MPNRAINWKGIDISELSLKFCLVISAFSFLIALHWSCQADLFTCLLREQNGSMAILKGLETKPCKLRETKQKSLPPYNHRENVFYITRKKNTEVIPRFLNYPIWISLLKRE